MKNEQQSAIYYQQARAIVLANHDYSSAIKIFAAESESLIEQKLYAAAADRLQQALPLYQKDEQRARFPDISLRDEIETLQRIGAIYISANNYSQASFYYHQAQQQIANLNDLSLAVDLVKRQIGTLSQSRQLRDVLLEGLHFLLALYQDERFYRSSPQLVEQAAQGEIDTLKQIAQLYNQDRDYQQSGAYYRQAQMLALKRSKPLLAIQILQEEKNYLQNENLYGLVLDRLQQILALYRHSAESTISDETNHEGEIATLQDLGVIYIKLKDYQRSASYYQEAINVAIKANNYSLVSQIIFGEIRFLREQQLNEVALERLQTALAFYRSDALRRKAIEVSRQGEIAVLAEITSIYSNLENYGQDQALNVYRTALRISRQRGDRTLSALILQQEADYLSNEMSRLVVKNQAMEHSPDESIAMQQALWQPLLMLYHEPEFREVLPQASQQGEIRTLQFIGWIYIRQANYQQGEAYYQQAQQMALASGDRDLAIQTLQNISDAFKQEQMYDSALVSLQALLLLYQKTESRQLAPEANRWGELTILQQIGELYARLGDDQQSAAYYQQARTLAMTKGDPQQVAQSLLGEAFTLGNLGMYDLALNRLQEALTLDRGDQLQPIFLLQRRDYELSILRQIRDLYSSAGNEQQASEYHQQILDLARATGNRRLIARIFQQEATYLSNGFLPSLQRALALYQSDEIRSTSMQISYQGEIATLRRIAAVYRQLGDYEKALSHYQTALRIAQKINDSLAEAYLQYEINLIYDNFGKPSQALERLQPYLSILGTSGSASVLHNIGSIYRHLGKYQQASEYYRRAFVILRNESRYPEPGVIAFSISVQSPTLRGSQLSLALAQKKGDRQQEGQARQSMGVAYFELQKYSQAIESFQLALKLFQSTGNCSGEAEALSRIGDTYIHLQQYSQALTSLQDALAKVQSNCTVNLSRRFRNRAVESYILNNLGTVYAELKQYDQALHYYDQASMIARDLDDDLFGLVKEETILSNMGRVLRQQNRIEEAIVAYQEAVNNWYKGRSEELGSSYTFGGEISSDTRILIELLQQQGREDEAEIYRRM